MKLIKRFKNKYLNNSDIKIILYGFNIILIIPIKDDHPMLITINFLDFTFIVEGMD